MTGEEPIVEALRRCADADADAVELWQEARVEAIAVARRRLIEAYADALVHQALAIAAGTSAPPAAAPRVSRDERAADVNGALGCYVYAIVGGDHAGAAAGMTGIDARGSVRLVTVDGLSAVVSDVDIEELRAAGADADVSDDSWLAGAARAHERVVTAAFEGAPTVPMRFGMVYPTETDVGQMLRRHAEAFRAELGRVGGAGEWTLKIWVDVEKLRERLTEAEPEAPADSEPAGRTGTAFLLQRRAQRQIDDRIETYVSARIEGLAAALDSKSRDWSDIPPSQRAAGARPLLARAFLVDPADVPRFTALVNDFASNTDDMGVRVALDGPFPAYHFTRLRLEVRDG